VKKTAIVRAISVIAGLDPAIHPLRMTLLKNDGCAGPGYAKGFAEAVRCWLAEALAKAASPRMTN
jgi:hypothetical protein